MAILAGALTAYPANVWLVARHMKHGMGTAQVLGRGGHSVEMERAAMTDHPRNISGARIAGALAVSLVALAIGMVIGIRFGVLAGS